MGFEGYEGIDSLGGMPKPIDMLNFTLPGQMTAGETPPAAPTPPNAGGNDLYKYAMLSAMLGSAGAGLGMAFRPWVKPPQALPSPQAQQMPITAPASLSALAQTRSARKGH